MYKDYNRTAAIVCGHVANGIAPILYAEKSAPMDDADSGWQFLCGEENEDSGKAQVWALGEVLLMEKSLVPFISAPVGTVLRREGVNDQWRQELHQP